MTGTQDQQPNSTDHSGTHTNLVRVPGISLVQAGRQVERWAERALSQVAAHDPFHWDVSLIGVPNVQADGQLGVATAYALVIYLPSPILRAPALGTVKLLSDNPSQAQVAAVVQQAVEELRAMRSDQLKMP
jgi:hypothetical protein